jgi:hypothetical protein
LRIRADLSSPRVHIAAERTGGFKLKTFDDIFNRVGTAVPRSGISGLTLTLHYLSFECMREPAQGVAAVIDYIDRLNSMQQAAYEKCQERLRWCCEACGQPPTCG